MQLPLLVQDDDVIAGRPLPPFRAQLPGSKKTNKNKTKIVAVKWEHRVVSVYVFILNRSGDEAVTQCVYVVRVLMVSILENLENFPGIKMKEKPGT